MKTVHARPYGYTFDPAHTAVVMIDMQRDFLEPGGFGETLGNDVSLLAKAIDPAAALIAGARKQGMLVIHTREGHRPDLADAPPAKIERGAPSKRIGDAGPMGRILIRGERGHDHPRAGAGGGRTRHRQAGQGAFFATDLHAILANRGIENRSSAASRPRSAFSSPCARRTTAAIAASSRLTAADLTSPSFTKSGCE